MAHECIFCRIANREIPVDPVFENDEFFAFRDAHPQAPVHVLVVPKAHYDDVMAVPDPGILGRGLDAAREAAASLGLAEEGFRIVINCRENGGQTVFHLHYHILGGRFMQWPPG